MKVLFIILPALIGVLGALVLLALYRRYVSGDRPAQVLPGGGPLDEAMQEAVAQLEALGWARLGWLGSVHSPSLMLAAPEATTRAVITHKLQFQTTLADYRMVVTEQAASYDVPGARQDVVVDYRALAGMLDEVLAAHERRVAEASAAHGEPIAVRTASEFLRVAEAARPLYGAHDRRVALKLLRQVALALTGAFVALNAVVMLAGLAGGGGLPLGFTLMSATLFLPPALMAGALWVVVWRDSANPVQPA